MFEPTGTPPGPDWVATHEVLVATEAAFGPDIPDLSYPTNTPAPTTVIGPEPTAFFPVEGTPAGTGAIVLDIPPFKIVPAMVQWENTWIKNYDQNRKQIRVWAGATGGPDLKPSAQGLLAIIMFEFAPERHGMTFSTGGDLYYTPTQSGAVRIVDAVDETLILQSTGGVIYYFDLPSRQFVPAIPGGTPTPLPTGAASTVTAIPAPDGVVTAVPAP
ncbi:MAG: hypothetical protein R2867_05130 [Caldilineaceae bacterium]